MGKGSGYTRTSTWRSSVVGISSFDIPSYATSGDNPTQLGRRGTSAILESKGFSNEDINSAFEMLNMHSEGGGAQVRGDTMIIDAIDNKTSVGKVLIAMAKINEQQFRQWSAKSVDRVKSKIASMESDFDFYGESFLGYSKSSIPALARRESPDDIKVYRGGDRKRLESWTKNEGGADVGNGIRIKVDHSSSVKEMLKTHYILGGISYMVGAPGESEVLFLRKKRK